MAKQKNRVEELLAELKHLREGLAEFSAMISRLEEEIVALRKKEQNLKSREAEIERELRTM